jgi:hypothetical protein
VKQAISNLLLISIILALASVAPLIFPVAMAGHGTLNVLAEYYLVPSIVGLAAITLLARHWAPWAARTIAGGALAGAIATGALEVVRIAGFHLGYMRGSMPQLMGVLLLNRFALGPDVASNLAGWTYHFWNGAAFGIIYVLLIGTRRAWAGTLFGMAVGVGFMLSPVVRSLGVGYFGLDFSIGFPIVVTLAHVAFGTALGFLARRFMGSQGSTVSSAVFSALGRRSGKIPSPIHSEV